MIKYKSKGRYVTLVKGRKSTFMVKPTNAKFMTKAQAMKVKKDLGVKFKGTEIKVKKVGFVEGLLRG